ncbi:MAG TPA: glycosyltransferase family 4 protein [Candidatus Acidoferrales bacterium]|nr:glycosyltransferase family 4 protein [Candidatus Acidoferrales bacterium]
MAEMRPVIALLGQKDTPTDGVEDYCTFLARALAERGIELKQVRMDWAEGGWVGALWRLWRDSAGWRHSWVLIQYTALSWSRRGFPFPALAVLAILRRRGARCAVVFHEPWRQGHRSRWIDRIRGACQDWLIHRLHRGAAKGIFTLPLDAVPWLAGHRETAVFIPIGANVPERLSSREDACKKNGNVRTIAIFCLSLDRNLFTEIEDLAYAVRYVQSRDVPVRLVVLGKGSVEARTEIERALADSGVNVSAHGMLPAEQIAETLSGASALLCVYGQVSQTRGSVLAGVACGLPIVGYSGIVTGTLLQEAGVELVPYRDREALGAALLDVLSDNERLEALRSRSREAQKKYFAWSAIAERYIEALGLDANTPSLSGR